MGKARWVLAGVAAVIAAAPVAAVAAPATAVAATTMDCKYTGPVVGNPGMQYICYVHHDDGSTEIFYAPGPAARP
ncbi:hypothetical protein CJ469_02159 [Nocardia farcinica]|uniref:Secreted protein n=1 Tax=Nocardia farcinica TaxID=37329 RepID=A0A449GKS7_NOCFR|nr:hypothetical protein CJ469_02159 [Nocardia farcinica]PFX03159.1 hypothetical protein CJ468_05724 [Nocardia farcinica]VFA93154.1 Uncharacterised protein [Nocardia farcinica]